MATMTITEDYTNYFEDVFGEEIVTAQEQEPEEDKIVYEAAYIVEKSIISKFKKYINANKIIARLESEYIYNANELHKIVNKINGLGGKNKIGYRPIRGMKNAWEVNFECVLAKTMPW